jgi:hypothetical protein
VYKTTNKVLTDRSGVDGWFGKLLRLAIKKDCKDEKDNLLVLQLGESRSGKLFFYMLYYLQFGTLPGGKTYAKCLLDIATLGKLKEEKQDITN